MFNAITIVSDSLLSWRHLFAKSRNSVNPIVFSLSADSAIYWNLYIGIDRLNLSHLVHNKQILGQMIERSVLTRCSPKIK